MASNKSADVRWIAGGEQEEQEKTNNFLTHHLARDDSVKLPGVLLGEVSVVDELERDEVLQTARYHLATSRLRIKEGNKFHFDGG